ncbi:thymidine kinase [Rubrivirga sp. S365]|uniref:Thymidine kinase n=1 Tax=Rubrivirga litoralis TaxID=3075598 RepID=A0ABU3BT39_9BACT|nr:MULTISPECIES: thymidine kinase [unclassified Rubrivirga]MDT0632405.1 thymidine kinase [Rubrivirga sp. F394]MDT7855224.1 thymidine kinase [Rubrivirga sp. S365]
MEPHVYTRDESGRRRGWVEVVCGSMFSGKTEELIRRLKRARIARQNVALFKPALDTRYDAEAVVSHDATALPAVVIHAADQILLLVGDADVVGIDEAQFFGPELVDVVERLARDGKRVVIAGLDQDYLGRPFEPVPQLMAVAEHVTKLHAVCVRCGAPANHSQRIVAEGARVLVGEAEAYEPRCRRCFRPRAVEAVPVAAGTEPAAPPEPAPAEPAPPASGAVPARP